MTSRRYMFIFLFVVTIIVLIFYFVNVKAGPTFDSCTEAHAAGFYNIKKGSVLYKSSLDRDHDSLACE